METAAQPQIRPFLGAPHLVIQSVLSGAMVVNLRQLQRPIPVLEGHPRHTTGRYVDLDAAPVLVADFYLGVPTVI